jgi:hypothetical protein
MTVTELAGADLACAPPFSPVWDSVLLAAGKVASKIRGRVATSFARSSPADAAYKVLYGCMTVRMLA